MTLKKQIISKVNRLLSPPFKKMQEKKYDFTKYFMKKKYEEVKIDRPIFLLGTQSGGLTIISRILHLHPDVYYATGNMNFPAGVDEMQNHYFHELPVQFRLGNKYKKYKDKVEDHPLFGRTRGWAYASDALYDSYRATEDSFENSDAEIFRSVISRCSVAFRHKKMNNSRFVDKSQVFSLKVPLINKIFTDAKFICVVRNPYVLCPKAADEVVENWNIDGNRDLALEICVQHWKNTFETIEKDFASLKKGKVFKYEDFLQNPNQVIDRMRDHCELSPFEFDAYLAGSKKARLPLGSSTGRRWLPVRQDTNLDRLKSISKKDLDYVEEQLGDLASKYGYEKPSI